MRERVEGSAGRRRGWLARGRRIEGVCWALLLGPVVSLAACANSEAATRVAVQSESSQPEQVVHRIAPSPAAAQPVRTEAPASAATGAEPASAVVSATKDAAAPGASARDPRASAQVVTAKHVEAELNRLEAELK